MSSDYLENKPPYGMERAYRFLLNLKLSGPQTSATFGSEFGITDEAARQQLVKLAREGLVEPLAESNGVGRPSQIWHLTPAGHALFPDGHADLALQLIGTVRSELGEDGMDRLISARERETRRTYSEALAGANELSERVKRLAAIRTREGYMAEATDDGDGFVLAEHHCPICAAAQVCQGFCRAELDVFKAVLGPNVQVERTDHILAGARRCAYRIRPKSIG